MKLIINGLQMQPTDSICHSFLHEVPQVLLAILCQYYVLDVL